MSRTKCRPSQIHSTCVTGSIWGQLSRRGLTTPDIPIFPHSSLSPPFHHATTCPTITERMQGPTRRSSDRKRAQTTSRVEERLDCRERTQSGLGVLHHGESPQKIGWWGAKRVYEKEAKLTVSAFSLPQFTQMHSNIFFTFTMKPTKA